MGHQDADMEEEKRYPRTISNSRRKRRSCAKISRNNLDEDRGYPSSGTSSKRSRRSFRRSSKSTVSESNSSGYGGEPSTTGSSNNSIIVHGKVRKIKKRDYRKMMQSKIKSIVSDTLLELNVTNENALDSFANADQVTNTSFTHDVSFCTRTSIYADNFGRNRENVPEKINLEGFSCVISMEDGIVMYTTEELKSSLGFPNNMWVGRSFMNFLHPKDCEIFTAHILDVIAPKNENVINENVKNQGKALTTIFCRIRRYRGLETCGFAVKDLEVSYTHFLLKFSLTNVNDENGTSVYLVVKATPCVSAYNAPSEKISNAIPFTIRHLANGRCDYLDSESVGYLGYLPQDVIGQCVLHMYHPDDLYYLTHVYQSILKDGIVPRCCRSFRIMAQNGYYVRMETEWSSFVNPWSRKLEFIIGKHHVVEGPANPEVFRPMVTKKLYNVSDDENIKRLFLKHNLINIMNRLIPKETEQAKEDLSKHCHDLALFVENVMAEPQPNQSTDECEDLDSSQSDSLRRKSPHRSSDSDTDANSSGSQPGHKRLNSYDILERYFESRLPYLNEINTCYEERLERRMSTEEEIIDVVGNNSEESPDSDNSAEKNTENNGQNAIDMCNVNERQLRQRLNNTTNELAEYRQSNSMTEARVAALQNTYEVLGGRPYVLSSLLDNIFSRRVGVSNEYNTRQMNGLLNRSHSLHRRSAIEYMVMNDITSHSKIEIHINEPIKISANISLTPVVGNSSNINNFVLLHEPVRRDSEIFYKLLYESACLDYNFIKYLILHAALNPELVLGDTKFMKELFPTSTITYTEEPSQSASQQNKRQSDSESEQFAHNANYRYNLPMQNGTGGRGRYDTSRPKTSKPAKIQKQNMGHMNTSASSSQRASRRVAANAENLNIAYMNASAASLQRPPKPAISAEPQNVWCTNTSGSTFHGAPKPATINTENHNYGYTNTAGTSSQKAPVYGTYNPENQNMGYMNTSGPSLQKPPQWGITSADNQNSGFTENIVSLEDAYRALTALRIKNPVTGLYDLSHSMASHNATSPLGPTNAGNQLNGYMNASTLPPQSASGLANTNHTNNININYYHHPGASYQNPARTVSNTIPEIGFINAPGSTPQTAKPNGKNNISSTSTSSETSCFDSSSGDDNPCFSRFRLKETFVPKRKPYLPWMENAGRGRKRGPKRKSNTSKE